MKKLLLVSALVLMSLCAFAQVAIIDMSVIAKSEYIQKANEEIGQMYMNAEKELQIRSENRFLGENEITELITLVNSKGDQNKIKEYQDTNTKRYDELQTLNQTKELTDEQKKRMSELTALTKKSGENFEARQKALAEQIETADAANSEKILNEVKAACEKVAKNKKLTLVIEKSSVFFGGTDITNDVINALPKSDKK